MAGQRQHRRRPDAQQGEVQVGEHRGVRQLDDDPVQRAQAQLEQDQSQPPGPLVKLPVRDRARLVDHRHPVRVRGQRGGEPVEQRPVLPVAQLPVAGRELGRERRHPVKHGRPLGTDTRSA